MSLDINITTGLWQYDVTAGHLSEILWTYHWGFGTSRRRRAVLPR
jgi:hypothetical protein